MQPAASACSVLWIVIVHVCLYIASYLPAAVTMIKRIAIYHIWESVHEENFSEVL